MRWEDIGVIRQQLLSPLPGAPAYARLIPSTRPGQNRAEEYENGRPSSVLILLFPGSSGELRTVFIQRPTYDGIHSGQISFPGGKAEPEDNNLQQTALRESEEEIGINSTDIEIIGKLSPIFIPPSRFWVTPFVGVLSYPPQFKADPTEVAGIITVGVDELLNPASISEMPISHMGGLVIVPCFSVQGIGIWGATAMILAEFLEVLRQIQR